MINRYGYRHYRDGDSTELWFCSCCGRFKPRSITIHRAVWGGLYCGDCEAAIKRTKPKPIPMASGLRKYLKQVESGEINPFKSFSVKMGENPENCTEYSSPLLLTPAGNIKKGAA